MKKKENKTEKKRMKTSEVVSLYNVLKGLKIGKLPKEGQFMVLRAARVFKPIATAFEDFLSDVRERLKPEDFDTVVEKSQRFKELTDEEKVAVNEVIGKYNKNVEECVKTELDKTIEVDKVELFGEDNLAILAEVNDLDVQTVLMLENIG
ncbi:MAG: hypothetical protein K2M13_11005 [Muribaculaceae bacterium]|nr:hypothetical protein [Muribaculaceae bacterium]